MLLTKFYDVLEVTRTDEQSLSAIVKLQAEHPIYEGHFPNFPVVPGVAMLQILTELTTSFVKQELILKTASTIKFLNLVNPNDNATLHFEIKISEATEILKVKNVTSFPDGTLVMKCNVNFAKS